MTKSIKILMGLALMSAMSAYASSPQALVPNVGTAAGNNVPWPSLRFIADTDKCEVDKLTGLEWLQSPSTKQYYWSSVPTDPMLQYIASLNAGAGTCGHKDWRLPNIAELASLVNYNDPTPADYLNHNGFQNVQAGSYFYWSSTAVPFATYAPGYNAWEVGMGNGMVIFETMTTGSLIWPVRGGQ